MKRKVIFGAAVTASLTAVGMGVFRYFSDMAVCRQRPQIPKWIQAVIDRGQDDDVFRPVVRSLTEDIAELPFEEWTQVSADGLLLKGRLFRPKEPKRLILLMHGWRSSWQKDFSVLVKPLLAMDCALFFADERAHGESEGAYITYGVKEKDDCVLWARRLAKEFPSLPLYLWGMSMGATAVMMASAEKDLPPTLRGVVADCGFSILKKSWSIWFVGNWVAEKSRSLRRTAAISKIGAALISTVSVPKTLWPKPICLFSFSTAKTMILFPPI